MGELEHVATATHGDHFRHAVEAIVEGQVLFTGERVPFDYLLLAVNPAYETLVGRAAEAIVGRSALALDPGLDPSWVNRYAQSVREGVKQEFQAFHKTAGRWYRVRAVPRGEDRFTAYLTDVTDLAQLIDQTILKDNLANLGQMTAVLNHEFGHVLSNLSVLMDLLDLAEDDREQRQGVVARLRKQLALGKALVAALKNSTYHGDGAVAPLPFDRFLDELLVLESAFLKSTGIKVERTSTSPRAIGIEAVLLQNVFLNLFKNAAQSMEGQRTGLIQIGAREEGRLLKITFDNNGPPISDGVGCRIFEPFYTTKTGARDHGTGLGLAYCRTILESVGGSIVLESGDPVRFEIALPLC